MKHLSPVMLMAILLVAGLTSHPAGQAPLISSVRASIAKGDFRAGERLVGEYRAARGVTPEMLEALSWLGRGALAAKRFEQADEYARQTYDLATATLKPLELDVEPHLPIALGAAIEVRAQASAQTGARSEAVAFLQRELASYKATSIAKRIQKNLNLLSLEGTPAPPLDLSESLGRTPIPLSALKGKVVLLFFWAHWCSDCKLQGPVLEQLAGKYGPQGLTVLAPTQRYGYVAGGRSATPGDERQHIAQVRNTHYAFLQENAVALAEANHLRYGVSTTPTLVLLDRQGRVQLYHPGRMAVAELDQVVQRWLKQQPADAQP